MTGTALQPTRWLRSAGRLALGVIVVWLIVLNVSVLASSAVNNARDTSGFEVWSVLWAVLALAPFVIAHLCWRRGGREGLSPEARLWSCILALFAVGLASLPFTLFIIAI